MLLIEYIFVHYGHGPLIPCVFKIPILLEISFFFQIKGIISSQKNILVQRKAIISLARMWNATNDRTNKEQTRSHPGRMRLRARAYALLLFKRPSLRSGRRRRPCEVFPIRVWGGVSWAHSFPPHKSLLTYFILGRTTVFHLSDGHCITITAISKLIHCSPSRSYKSCFWVLVCTHRLRITSEFKYAGLEPTSKTKQRLQRV